MKTINTRYKGFKITTPDFKWFEVRQADGTIAAAIGGDLAFVCMTIDSGVLNEK